MASTRLWTRRRGSSPRVRGKHLKASGITQRARLIPARAGKTNGTGLRRSASPAHPRACGENLAALYDIDAEAGSSPRVRGKPRRSRPARPVRGLIPARAGKTFLFSQLHQYGTAHPRACGENLSPVPAGWAQDGSSPRVRGKRTEDLGGDHRGGLIPARAGKTHRPRHSVLLPWAHPRACGENLRDAGAAVWEMGSSPRVRGKRPPGNPHTRRAGLIPARAGKTRAPDAAEPAARAHPRACGENTSPGCRRARGAGSSPRVRGKLVGVRPQRLRQRLIPARAGKTPSCGAPPSWRTAHPRACGENLSPVPAGWAQDGSSPRVRGKRGRADAPCRGGGLIPARAGKTG